MPWNDDSWKDGYDTWKLASPYDDGPEGECDHVDAEYDLLMGEAQYHCGRRWSLTSEEMFAECQRIAEYQEAMRREERWARWYRLTAWLRNLIPVDWRLRRKHHKLLISDDEIPF